MFRYFSPISGQGQALSSQRALLTRVVLFPSKFNEVSKEEKN